MSEDAQPTVSNGMRKQSRASVVPRSTDTDEPEILVMPEPGQYTFEATDGRPILQFATYPPHGDTWLLWYLGDLDSPSRTVREHVIGGRIEDIDWALGQARDHVRRFRQSPPRRLHSPPTDAPPTAHPGD